MKLDSKSQSKALSVDERALLYRESTAEADSSLGARRLDRWVSHRAMTPEVLGTRLGDIGVTQERLAFLLAAESDAAPLSWTAQLEPALDATVDGVHVRADRVLGAVYQHAYDDLRRRLGEVAEARGGLAFAPDLDALTMLLVDLLHRRISVATGRAITLEINLARILGRLSGDTPEERFQSFLETAIQPAYAAEFFNTYPVVARVVATAIRQTTVAAVEFVERLADDWESVCALVGAPLGTIVAFEGGQGDPHCDGRSVVIAAFDGGERVVYKPRPLAPELAFAAATDWLNAQGFTPAIEPLRSLDRGSYGWQAYIEPSPCPADEVSDFYTRQGGLLAVLYAFGGSDFHFENVIASGAHPHLIDLETVLHPQTPLAEETLDALGATGLALRHSVMSVGMLPDKLSLGFGGATDLSGLGASEGQETPFTSQQCEGAGTDEVRYVSRPTQLQAGRHRPTMEGRAEPVDARAHAADIERGFRAAYRILRQNRQAVLDEVLSGFEGVPVRAILRPTWFYTCLLSDTCHPDNARDGVEREYLLENLWLNTAAKPEIARAIRYEKRDLVNCDVPYFWTPADSTSLFSSRGEEIPDYFQTSALDDARSRVNALSEDDEDRQAWIIQSAMMTPEAQFRPRRHATSPLPSEEAVAVELGDRLRALAVESDRGAGWLGLTFVDEANWKVQAQGADLYSGTSGIALFLGTLGEATGEPRFRTLAERAVRAILRVEPRPEDGCGLFEGWAGIVYALSHLGALWSRDDLLDEAERRVSVGTESIEADTVFDVIGGVGGCISGVRALHAVRPSRLTHDALISCADRLERSAVEQSVGVGWPTGSRRALAGMSHGNAGIALALQAVAALVDAPRYAALASRALDFEDTLYDEARRNWLDVRELGADAALETAGDMVAWCHGAPGVGLARVAGYALRPEERLRRDAERAVETTIERGLYGNECACHGDLGNVDLLLEAARVMGLTKAASAAHRRVRLALERPSLRSGIPDGLETPGLMVGDAGIGYQLLRAADPERIPSVLALQPPR